MVDTTTKTDTQQTTETINDALRRIDVGKRSLEGIHIEDPTLVQGTGIDIDFELAKLAKVLKILVNLEYLCGSEFVRLESAYNRQTMIEARELTEGKLSDIGIVKSNKFKFIKALLFAEYAEMSQMDLKHKYFRDMRNVYGEWVNIYKKVREVPHDVT